MRKLTVALSCCFSIVLGWQTAALGDQVPCGDRENGQAVICDPSRNGSSTVYISVPTSGNSSGSSASSGATKRYVPYNRLSTGPDGQPCATTGYVEEGVAPPDERLLVDPNPAETNIPVTGNDLSILANYPPCPERPLAPGESAPLETRAMTAARIWERMPLPKPQPFISPGRAITGKLAYLETRGEIVHSYNNDTLFGPLQIFAQGSYRINWGDGTTSGPYSFEGGPWPNGRITHDYQNVGRYNVVVTEKWTATWSLDGESGILRTLQTTGGIGNFPVEQVQAVIGR